MADKEDAEVLEWLYVTTTTRGHATVKLLEVDYHLLDDGLGIFDYSITPGVLTVGVDQPHVLVRARLRHFDNLEQLWEQLVDDVDFRCGIEANSAVDAFIGDEEPRRGDEVFLPRLHVPRPITEETSETAERLLQLTEEPGLRLDDRRASACRSLRQCGTQRSSSARDLNSRRTCPTDGRRLRPCCITFAPSHRAAAC